MKGGVYRMLTENEVLDKTNKKIIAYVKRCTTC